MKRRSWRNETRGRARRPSPRLVRAGVLGLALAAGLAVASLRGEALVARALPERAAHLRLAVVGNVEAAPLELAAAAGLGPDSRLATLDLAEVQAGLATHPWVARARVATLPPDWLLVAVEERTPVAVARIGGDEWLADTAGAAFLRSEGGATLPALVRAPTREDPRLADGVAWVSWRSARTGSRRPASCSSPAPMRPARPRSRWQPTGRRPPRSGCRQSIMGSIAKRAFDVVVSSVLLLVCLPVLLVAAACIWLESGLPVFYRQERVGRGGRVFTLYKLRSMRQDAERGGKAQWASANDSRTTRVGRIIRRSRIDSCRS